ncbi:MAG TPA: response regulator [Syntrophales bacterium]|nr:response regulator [Syntrophales bacterium]
MSIVLKILLVEDNIHDATLIKEMIYEDDVKETDDVRYELVHRKTCEDALSYLSENKMDVILLDLSLPDSSGLDTVKKMVEREKNTPIIVLTGLDDEAVAIKAMQVGVQDYLNKNQINGILLVRSLKYSIERFYTLAEKERLIKELKEALENVKILSGLLPICANCKNIRSDDGYWMQVESYLADHSNLIFTHSICPSCAKQLYPEFYKKKVEQEKRHYPRKKVTLSALISTTESNDKALLQTGLVLDISLGGVRISMPGSCKIEENRKRCNISITFTLPNSEAPVTIECLPRYVLHSNSETYIGTSLVDSDVESYKTLQKYLINSLA